MVQKLIDDFKRSNKERKLKIAVKNGFDTSEKYLNHLQELLKLELSNLRQEPVKKSTIHNVFIMDASGSMYGDKYDNGIKGIRELIESIKNDKLTDNTVTFIEFAHDVGSTKTHFFLAKDCSYAFLPRGANGGTPLYRVLGATIEKLLKAPEINKDDKVLLNIVTDGDDTNGFGDYTNLPLTLRKVQEENNFTITFVGTKSDVNRSIKKLNLDESNTLVHNNAGSGIKEAFNQTISSRTMYSSNVSKGIDVSVGFYKKIN